MDGGRGSRRRANRNRRRIRKQNANTNPTIQINPINQNDPENQSDDSSGSSQSALNKRDQKNINSANLGANTTEISDAKNSCNGGAEVPYEMPSTSTVGPGITFNAETTTEEEFNRLMDGLFCEKMARIKSDRSDQENHSDDSSDSSQSVASQQDQKNINKIGENGPNGPNNTNAKNSCNGGADVPNDMPSTSTVGPSGVQCSVDTTQEKNIKVIFCDRMSKSPTYWTGAADASLTSPYSTLLEDILASASFDELSGTLECKESESGKDLEISETKNA